MKTLLPLYFLLKNLFAGCHQEIRYNGFQRDRVHRIERTINLDTTVKECSGMAGYNGYFWSIGDSGNPPELYGIDEKGHCRSVLTHPDLRNKDWEELTVDTLSGTFYIGDTGNNGNRRKDLKVYALDSAGKVSQIRLSYALQEGFPPPKPLRNFDCEAMVYAGDSLFLFSKNRGLPLVNLYGFAVKDTTVELKPLRQWFLKGMITGAAFDGASGQLVVLAYGKLYWFKTTSGVLQAKPWLIRKIPFYGQTEAICFDPEGHLILSNEKGKQWKIMKKK